MTIRDLVLPTTDGGALFQAVAALPLYVGALVAVRRSRDLVWFVAGLALLTYAWFALRTVH